MKEVVETATKLFAVAVATIYIFGFIVINSHLYKFGLSDFEFDKNNIVAGLLFVLFLLCYYLFPGRTIFHLPVAIENEQLAQKALENPGGVSIASMVAKSNIVLQICLASNVFASFCVTTQLTFPFFLYLSGGFVFYITIEKLNLHRKYPNTALLLALLFRLGSGIFFLLFSPGVAIFIAFIYSLMTMYVWFVFNDLHGKTISQDSWTFTGLHTFVALLSVAHLFGSEIYERIRGRYGGGEPLVADIQLLPERMPFELSFSSTIKNGRVLHESSRYISFQMQGDTFRIPKDSVVAIRSKESKDAILATFEKMQREKDAPNRGVAP